MRYFNGICTRFGSAGREGRPSGLCRPYASWLWLASRRSDCKISSSRRFPTSSPEVLARYGYRSPEAHQNLPPVGLLRPVSETDMNFVMRLMEHEGIYFSFDAAAGTHTLVMSTTWRRRCCQSSRASKYYGTDATTVADETLQ